MNILKGIVLSGCTLVVLNSCTQQSSKNEKSATIEKSTTTSLEVDGQYVSQDYENRNKGYDWVGVIIKNIDEGKVSIKIRSRADKKKPTCTLDAVATKVKEGVYYAKLEGKNVVFTFNETSVTISTENHHDEGVLNFYCSGGASIAGAYTKIATPLDSTQMDKTQ